MAEELRAYVEMGDRPNVVQVLVESGLFALDRAEQIAEALIESAECELEDAE